MNQKINYNAKMEETIAALAGSRPSLLLHSCCGPCSSHVLSVLTAHFAVTLFYFNPNIAPEAEYRHRLAEQTRLAAILGVPMVEAAYDPAVYYQAVCGLEQEPEGGRRCHRCFQLRLEATAEKAAELGFAYFTTTLSVSPHKDAQALNAIGAAAGQRFGVPYLYADFKKKGGYLHSIELSKTYGLYRQNYCGCIFSLPREKEDGNSQETVL